MLTKTNR